MDNQTDYKWWNEKEREMYSHKPLAWVFIDKEREMIGIDKATKKGYKLCDEVPIVKKPFEEVKYDRFERWCGPFDT